MSEDIFERHNAPLLLLLLLLQLLLLFCLLILDWVEQSNHCHWQPALQHWHRLCCHKFAQTYSSYCYYHWTFRGPWILQLRWVSKSKYMLYWKSSPLAWTNWTNKGSRSFKNGWISGKFPNHLCSWCWCRWLHNLLLLLLCVVSCIPNQSLPLTSYSFAAALAAQLVHRSIQKYTLLLLVAGNVLVAVAVVVFSWSQL